MLMNRTTFMVPVDDVNPAIIKMKHYVVSI